MLTAFHLNQLQQNQVYPSEGTCHILVDGPKEGNMKHQCYRNDICRYHRSYPQSLFMFFFQEIKLSVKHRQRAIQLCCSEALWPWLMVLLLPNIIHSHSKNLFGFPKKTTFGNVGFMFHGLHPSHFNQMNLMLLHLNRSPDAHVE